MTESEPGKTAGLRRYWWVGGILIALAVVFVLAPMSSGDPDGLNRVAEDKGFADKAEDSRWEWLPNYQVPGIDDPYLSKVLAGAAGVGIVVVAAWGFGLLVARSRRDRAA